MRIRLSDWAGAAVVTNINTLNRQAASASDMSPLLLQQQQGGALAPLVIDPSVLTQASSIPRPSPVCPECVPTVCLPDIRDELAECRAALAACDEARRDAEGRAAAAEARADAAEAHAADATAAADAAHKHIQESSGGGGSVSGPGKCPECPPVPICRDPPPCPTCAVCPDCGGGGGAPAPSATGPDWGSILLAAVAGYGAGKVT